MTLGAQALRRPAGNLPRTGYRLAPQPPPKARLGVPPRPRAAAASTLRERARACIAMVAICTVGP